MQSAKKSAKNILLCSLFSGLIACGGSNSDGGFAPTLPADAARISAANATDIANSVFGSIDGLVLITGAKGEATAPSLLEILRFATDRVYRAGQRSAAVASRTEIEDCDPSDPQGTVTSNVDEGASAATGFAVFENCALGGLTINGSFTFTSWFDDDTGEYTDDFNGSLNFDFGSEDYSLVFDLDEEGNVTSGDFSSNVAFSVSGVPDGGFLVTTSKRITGNGFDINGGRVIVHGADETRLRIEFSVPNTADVDLDEGSGYNFFATCVNLTCI